MRRERINTHTHTLKLSDSCAFIFDEKHFQLWSHWNQWSSCGRRKHNCEHKFNAFRLVGRKRVSVRDHGITLNTDDFVSITFTWCLVFMSARVKRQQIAFATSDPLASRLFTSNLRGVLYMYTYICVSRLRWHGHEVKFTFLFINWQSRVFRHGTPTTRSHSLNH